MNWLRGILNMCHKELLAILKDPANRAIIIVPVLMQTLLFGYAATYDLTEVNYALVDASPKVLSSRILAKIDGSGVFKRQLTTLSMQEAQEALDREKIMMIIRFGQDFDVRAARHDAPAMQIIVDARNANTASMAIGYISSIVNTFIRDSAPGALKPPQIITRNWYNPNLQTRYSMVVALIAALSFMQTMILAALSVAREREQGTFDQLLVTPLQPFQLMVGKALAPMLVSLFQASMVLLLSVWWFQIPFNGSYVTLYIGLILFSLASVGFGLAISALAANMQQAMLSTFCLIMPLVLLSGLSTPIANMPLALQYATYLNPLRYAIDFVRRVYLEGADMSLVYPDMLALSLIAALSLPLATWLFRHRLA